MVFLTVAVIVMAGLEILNVGAIMPFLIVAGNPSAIHDYRLLEYSYRTFGFGSDDEFLVALGFAVLSLLVVTNVWIALTTYWQTRFVWAWNHAHSSQLLRYYLYRPYTYFLSRNTSDLSKNILSEMQHVTGQLLVPAIQGLGRSFAVLSISTVLFLTEPVLALIVTLIFGGSYSLIFVLVQRKLKRIGSERLNANSHRFTAAAEALVGIKDVKLLGREEHFLKRFDRPSGLFSRHQATSQVIAQLPRYGIETVAFGGMILLVVFLTIQRGNLAAVLPLLGFYAFAGYRLMPAVQNVFRALSHIRFFGPALDSVLGEMEPVERQPHASAGTIVGCPLSDSAPLLYDQELSLDSVTFSYPFAEQPAIQALTLSIQARTAVGLVGSTGSGKTTVADVLLGLVRPQEGTIWVDGVSLTDGNIGQWQRCIGYVPQDIFLIDTSVTENIAFGLPRSEINMEAVRRAARVAMIDEFVCTEMPNGYETVVGERGIRLSGGQRQRIGIARALYGDPSVLIFDEATSALDNRTEDILMEAIRSLKGRKTIITIAHRLSTLRDCDVIYMLEKGTIVAKGSYAELASGQGRFAELSRLPSQDGSFDSVRGTREGIGDPEN